MPTQQADIELRDDERTRCEIWTRVMGYHRPITSWNPGKQSEQAERRYYKEPDCASPAAAARGKTATA